MLLTHIPKRLAEKIRTTRTALEGERKQVAVLFADTKGATELIEGLDPEAARRLLDPVLYLMIHAVHRYEGTVNQVLGDGIMALFGLTRFVGRQTEFGALRQALERAGAGYGQVAAVVGEAGVGKSRLVYEFIHSPHPRNWLVLETASVSYGKATAYFPVVDLLKRYVHMDDGDDTRTIQAKVTGQVLTPDATLQETIPALLALLDALSEPPLPAARTAAAAAAHARCAEAHVAAREPGTAPAAGL